MQDNYSDNINSLLDDSRKEARRHRSRTVRPEHILMAMLKRRNTITDKIMQTLHVSKPDVTIDCERQLLQDVENAEETQNVENAENAAPQEKDAAYPELDEKTKQLMRLAYLEARMAKKPEVQTEHLLLAMLHDVDNNQARSILEHYNMNYENVSQCIASQDESNQVAEGENDSEKNSINDITPQSAMNLSDDEFDDTINEQPQKQDSDTATRNKTQGSRQTPVIDAFAIDLTAAAADSKLDPVVGREKEIMRLQ